MIFQSCPVQQMEKSDEQWHDWEREGEKQPRNGKKKVRMSWIKWDRDKKRGAQTKKKETEDSTYIGIHPSHDVSNDNRSIFKFQLQRKEKTSSENGGWHVHLTSFEKYKTYRICLVNGFVRSHDTWLLWLLMFTAERNQKKHLTVGQELMTWLSKKAGLILHRHSNLANTTNTICDVLVLSSVTAIKTEMCAVSGAVMVIDSRSNGQDIKTICPLHTDTHFNELSLREPQVWQSITVRAGSKTWHWLALVSQHIFTVKLLSKSSKLLQGVKKPYKKK